MIVARRKRTCEDVYEKQHKRQYKHHYHFGDADGHPEETGEPFELDEDALGAAMEMLALKKSGMMEHEHEKVYMESNHIYFKDSVTNKSVDKLVKLIRSYQDTVKSLEKDTFCMSFTPKPLYLHIASGGGSVSAGLIAYDYIKMATVPIYTVVEGYVASMASVMSVAGAKRFMLPSASILIHQIRGEFEGKYEDFKDEMKGWDQIMEKFVDIYYVDCKKKMTKKYIRETLMREERWDFDKCLKNGLIDGEYRHD